MPSHHHQILTLARAGNPARAWALFVERGLAEVGDDPRVLTLKGRLLKDRAKLALREGREDDARTRFAAASEAYLAAHALKADSYPLINAATLALLSGDAPRSRELAREVLQLIEADPEEGENAYWREATRAEALLLLGDAGAAEAALAQGIARLPRAWEDHAATVGQFELIIAQLGGDAAWLDAYRPPASVHFSGLIGLDPEDPDLADAIAAAIAELQPGFGFGALAAGADIMIAEALIASDAQLCVTLPLPVDQFRAVSVEPFGADWVTRFDALLEHAESVDELAAAIADEELPLAGIVEMGSLAAMGETIRRARVLNSRAHALTIVAPGEHTRTYIARWQEAGLPLHTIATARVAEPWRKGPAPDNGTIGAVAVASSGKVLAVGAIGNCLTTLRAHKQSGEASGVGVLVDLITGATASADQVQLGGDLAKAAPPGAIYIDRQSAMIAKVVDPAIHVEEIGELPSLRGPVPLWSIIL